MNKILGLSIIGLVVTTGVMGCDYSKSSHRGMYRNASQVSGFGGREQGSEHSTTGATNSNSSTGSATGPSTGSTNSSSNGSSAPAAGTGSATPGTGGCTQPCGTGGSAGSNPPRPSSYGIVSNNISMHKYEPPYTLTGANLETGNVGATGPSTFNVTCADQEAVVAYRLRSSNLLNQIDQIGCKNINGLGTIGIHWVDVNAGAANGTEHVVIAPRDYAMTGFAASAGNNFSVTDFLPQAQATEASIGLVPVSANPSDGGWSLWRNYGKPFGISGGIVRFQDESCPADSVLIGVAGRASTQITGLMGICRHLELTHPKDPTTGDFTLGALNLLPAIGVTNGNPTPLQCADGEIVVAVRGLANPAMEELEFGCKAIDLLYDANVPVNWTGSSGGGFLGSSFEIEAPRGYAIAGYDVLLDINGAIKDLNPRFVPVAVIYGVLSDAEFVFGLPAGIGGNDPTVSGWTPRNRCSVAAGLDKAVLTGVDTLAFDEVNNVQATCRPVTVN